MSTHTGLRSWLPTAAASVTISSLGIGLAMATDLAAPPESQATQALPQPSGPAPLEPYDPARGAAAVHRLNTPAQTKATMLQRRYLLAVEQQTIAQRVADIAADRRRRALRRETKSAEREQIKFFQEQERRRIQALVARQLAEKLRQAKEAAEAEAERQRRNGLEPPASQAFEATTPQVGRHLPVASSAISAGFGAFGSWSSYHTGVDFRAGYGDPVYAPAAGVVVAAGNTGGWAGIRVAVRHSGGLTTMSAHLSSVAVSPGQVVSAGQILGRVGQTGRAFGPHLHFEVYPPGVRPGDVYRAVDPVPWLRSAG